MKRILIIILGLLIHGAVHAEGFPETYDQAREGAFPLAADGTAAGIYIDEADFKVVEIAAGMLADDIERVTGTSSRVFFTDNHKDIHAGAAEIAGTLRFHIQRNISASYRCQDT